MGAVIERRHIFFILLEIIELKTSTYKIKYGLGEWV